MEVQIFGTRKSNDTKKALRFFTERGIKVHLVDLEERGPSPGELEKIVRKFGIDALIDRGSKRFRDLGLATASPSRDAWMARLLAEPLLLSQPIVRCQEQMTLGLDEAAWKGWAGK